MAFTAMGFLGASWAARIQRITCRLDLAPSGLGLVLLAMATGSVLALPLSGPAVKRFGSRVVLAGMALLAAVGIATVSGSPGHELHDHLACRATCPV